MSEIVVAPWGTRDSIPNDPSAPMHTALWNVAREQAILARMKKHNEDWPTADKNVTNKEIVEHLNTVCDENGFRRVDGTGSGRDPNLIFDGERIKVRIDPASQTTPGAGINHSSPKALDAYDKAVSNTNGEWDPKKKDELDAFVAGIPNFASLPDDTKVLLIEAYGREGVNKQSLSKLTGSELFQKGLTVQEQNTLLASYGVKGKELITAEADKLAGQPLNDDNTVRLRILASAGFHTLNVSQQQQFLDKLSKDGSFRAAIGTIIRQGNFTDKNVHAQGYALDVLRRYSARKGEGYGEVEPENKAAVLVKVYNDVLATKEFGLPDGPGFPPLSAGQTYLLDQFAKHKAEDVKAS